MEMSHLWNLSMSVFSKVCKAEVVDNTLDLKGYKISVFITYLFLFLQGSVLGPWKVLLKSKVNHNPVNTTFCPFAYQGFCKVHLGSKEDTSSL